ncbi:MAG: hypothetical protein ABJL67_08840 [Sulfitobacter sp.]
MTEMLKSPLVPDAAVQPQKAKTVRKFPNQDQIEPLIAAGLVTHLVTVKEKLEPLFAAGQIHELPEVRFVAAFEGGIIALGCPNGLPENLADLAYPAPKPKPSAEARALTEGMRQIALTSQRLESVATAFQPIDNEIQELRLERLIDRIAALESTILSQAADTKEQALNSVEEQLFALTEKFENQPDHMQMLKDIASRLDALPEPVAPDLSGIEDKLDSLAENLCIVSTQTQKLTAVAKEIGAPADLAQTLNKIDEQLQQTHTELTERFDKLPEPINPDFSPIDSRLDGLTDQIDIVADQTERLIAMAQEVGPLSTLATVLSQINTRVETLGTNDDTQTILDAISDTQSEIKDLAERPMPDIDLSDQRKSFSQFATVLGMIVQRIEKAVTELPNPEVEANALAALHSDVASLLNRPDPQPLLQAQEDTMQTALDQLIVVQGLLGHDSADVDMMPSDLAEIIRSLPDLLESTFKKAPDPEHLLNTLEHLRTSVEQLPTHMQEIATAPIIKSEVPAEQTLPPVLQSYGTEIDTIAAQLERITTDVCLRRAPIEPTVHERGGPATGTVVLSDLRTQFAEMIANQINQTAVVAAQPSGNAH